MPVLTPVTPRVMRTSPKWRLCVQKWRLCAKPYERRPMRVDVPALLTRLGIQAQLRGREWTALCPNPAHDDKHPSWRMREEPGSKKHGAHKCHACGLGGGPDELVMAVLGVGREDARAWLSGVTVDVPVADSVEVAVGRFDAAFRFPEGVVHKPLAQWGSAARAYAESRGLTAQQVETWGIGYAVAGKLAGRIVIPKCDEHGKLRGYSARTFIGDARKYLEASAKDGASPWVVFGECYWPLPDIRATKTLWVAEGAVNALALERVGCDFVAATSGSTLHPTVAAKFASFKEVVTVTDPDAAGDSLALMIETMTARHTKTFRLRLPDGTDAQQLGDERLARVVGEWALEHEVFR